MIDYSRKITPICCHAYRVNRVWEEAENWWVNRLNVTGSTKTVLIAQDRKFDSFTQTQSLMNALSSFTATVDQSKVVCFCWLLF